MIIPSDWDTPGPENQERCEKFEFSVYENTGITLPYRYYLSDTDKALPLVLYLHGADAVGNDNRAHLEMHDIGTIFADDNWQSKHPCHIIAPQYNSATHWSLDEVEAAVDSLMKEKTKEWNADKRRVYIYGYSAGGVGTLKYIKLHTKMYAGAISICGATSREKLKALEDIPLWMIHAKDDAIVKASYGSSYGNRYHLGSADIFEELGEKAKQMRYTRLDPGYMQEKYKVNPHCSWVVVSQKIDYYGEWLFSQKR